MSACDAVGPSLEPLLLITFVAGVNTLRVPVSIVSMPTVFPVISLNARFACADRPLEVTPVPFRLIPLWNRSTMAVLLIPDAELLAPQLAVVGVLAFVPNELTVTPHVLSWMSL